MRKKLFSKVNLLILAVSFVVTLLLNFGPLAVKHVHTVPPCDFDCGISSCDNRYTVEIQLVGFPLPHREYNKQAPYDSCVRTNNRVAVTFLSIDFLLIFGATEVLVLLASLLFKKKS